MTEEDFERIEAQLAKIEIYGNRTDTDIAELRDLDLIRLLSRGRLCNILAVTPNSLLGVFREPIGVFRQ